MAVPCDSPTSTGAARGSHTDIVLLPPKNTMSYPSTTGGAMKRKVPSEQLMHQPLNVSNYHLKFRSLLECEENAHADLLKMRWV